MCFYCGKVSLHSCPVTSLGVPIQQLQKECLRLLWLLENKLVFNKQESLKLSSCQDWEWHSKSPASSLKTEQHSLWWRVARGYSRIHLITTQEHRLTSSYSHTSERLWEIANNAQMNNFFLHGEEFWAKLAEQWACEKQHYILWKGYKTFLRVTFCAL